MNIIFTSVAKLKNTLCDSKDKVLPNNHCGVYELSWDCGGNKLEKQKKCVLTESSEHQEDSMTGKLAASGATEHSKDCHGWFNRLHPRTLKKLFKYTNENKRIFRNKQFRG